ncbi:hypothetical protein NPIL_283221 [Nephila pilipes]|uniref:Uncharacterized protein n=1 Tax=Nephila pilipes TaxID=299642 RepID=A0A8X6P7W8_NEPPI|nr:hypothetical protein NPIL_283221 [Nephila pilipes]
MVPTFLEDQPYAFCNHRLSLALKPTTDWVNNFLLSDFFHNLVLDALNQPSLSSPPLSGFFFVLDSRIHIHCPQRSYHDSYGAGLITQDYE